MSETKIEWASHVWNPIRGCTRVSAGCQFCYAEVMAARFSDEGFWGHGFAKRTAAGGRWTGEVELIPEKLGEPLRWRKPRRVFINSTSDLFHEKLSFEEIAAVVGVIAASPRHTFMTLTKRAKRMREWFEWISHRSTFPGDEVISLAAGLYYERNTEQWDTIRRLENHAPSPPWPLPNWQVGVSAEDQKRWDERIPELLQCPAAVRFVSAEPLLGPIDCGFPIEALWGGAASAELDLVIVGGESGNGARPCRLEWIDSIVDQCRAAKIAVFVKQHGANASTPEEGFQVGGNLIDKGRWPMLYSDKKGGDPAEWPGGLKRFPREMP